MKNEAFATAFGKVTEVGRWLSCAAFFILCSSFFISCSNPTPEELASLAAKGYYEHLAAGEYDAYLEGVNGVKDAPDDYKSQYRIAAEQYVKRVNQLHQGIKMVEVSSAKTDSMLHCTNVFLVLTFGDSSREEICVPMVEAEGVFRMR
jgi:hypothetical protein